MKFVLLIFVIATLTVISNGLLGLKKPLNLTGDNRIWANVKIYSNLAEVITPLGKLPLEFSAEDWNDIRSDSVTLVGANVTVIQQTITEKKKTLKNTQVYVRSPISSDKETKYIIATLVDEKRNIVKLVDKDISKDPIFLTISSDQMVYSEEPPQSKYYVNFTYETTDAVSLSYLRSNLNWKTQYQLNLFDEPKTPILIAMANIRNDGQSTVDIEHAELLGGDINLQMYQQSTPNYAFMVQEQMGVSYSRAQSPSFDITQVPTITQGEEVAGLYLFAINQPFSIEPKTNYILPMFRPKVAVERYGSISKVFYGSVGSSTGKAQRSYRLSSDQFLSRGNCIIRESDRLVGETSLPDLAAKNKHEFSIGQDADIVYKENVTLISSHVFNKTTTPYGVIQTKTRSTYDISLLLKNFKKNRAVKIEYEQNIHGNSVKLLTLNTNFTQEISKIKYKTTLAANDEKLLSYKVEIVN